MTSRAPLAFALVAAVSLGAGCAPSSFHGHVSAGRWQAAAAAFAADTALTRDADAVFAGALLYGTPRRETWDPRRALELLELFTERFPGDPRRADALDRIALLRAVIDLDTELRALKAIDLGRSTGAVPRKP